MAGVLYIVSTPIGNLDDITIRALQVLKTQAAWIACEDTRHTATLLRHFGITTRMVSYHEHNEAARSAELLALLEAGESGALVSDAGTPLLSDPGYRLVAGAAGAGVTIVPVPGASALLSAVAGSGLPTDAIYFGGFLPAKSGQRLRALQAVAAIPATLVFYEAPHRILEALDDINGTLGDRRIVLAREITKLHEEFLRGTVSQVRQALGARPAVKGEMTLVISREPAEGAAESLEPVADSVERMVGAGMPRMDAIKQVAKERGLPKRDVYRQIEEGR